MKTKKYKFRPKSRYISHEVWVTQQQPTKRAVQARRNRDSDRALKGILSCGSVALRLLLKSGKKPRLERDISYVPRRRIDYDAAQRNLESIMDIPQGNITGGIGMDTLDILPSIAKHNIVVLCRLRSSRQSHYVALAEGV